ncbi:MAG: diguanylate cyclase domain-containing protein [Leptospirillum sp.]|jgi:diguanylate cyclase (GGDEF)-like protein
MQDSDDLTSRMEEPSQQKTHRGAMHPLMLSFFNPLLERSYQDAIVPRLKVQSRWAIIIGVFIYIVSGGIDPWVIPENDRLFLWLVRGMVAWVGLWAIFLTYRPSFQKSHPTILSLTAFAAGAFFLIAMSHVPSSSEQIYYVGIILITFWTYNSIGLRFYHAIRINIFFILSYFLLLKLHFRYPTHIIFYHLFFILAANIIGGITGYIMERQRRKLFIREYELDEERNHQLIRSLHDRLTGLPNRELLDDRIEQAIIHSRQNGFDAAGLYIDIDGFKAVNDTWGHEVGDWTLLRTSERILSILQLDDTLSRLGGDEFFILIQKVSSEDEVILLAKEILRVLEAPFSHPEIPKPLSISASIGICLFPFHECSTKTIIHAADQAMYQVKKNGKNAYQVAIRAAIS